MRESLTISAHRRKIVFALVATATLLAGAPSFAGPYPDHPIKLMVPFAPGGGGDTMARTVFAKVSEVLGQSVIIENRAGAGGNIGAAIAARAEPDGYNLLYGTNGTHAINHALYKSTGFDPIADFVPISRVTEIALLLVVNPNVPAKSAAELVAYLKANPGKVNVATAGIGTSSHLASEMFKSMAGVDFLTVNYRGGGPAMTDMLSGEVQMMIEVMPNAAQHVENGKLRVLAVSTKDRLPQMPDVPTLNEGAVPGFVFTAWDAVFAPRGTPPETVKFLNAAMRKALDDPELKKSLLMRGAQTTPSTPDELAAYVKSEFDRLGAVVRASTTKID